MMSAPTRLCAVAFLCAALSGCGGRPPVTHYYVLEVADLAATRPNASGLEIGVRAFRVAAPYDQDRIVYRVGEGSPEVGFYAYHRWAAPLSRMLPGVVADGLRGAAGVGSIEPAMPGRRYGAWLEGRVVAVEEVDLADAQRVRVQIVLRLTSAEDEELWSGTLDAAGSARTDQVRVLVETMSERLGEALVEARGDLAGALAGSD